MRVVYAVLCAVLLLFAAAQYNDPDPLLWAVIYGVPAVLAGLAAWQPRSVRYGVGRTVLLACTVLALFGLHHYWPQAPQFWKISIWWDDEEAREGLGMMIVAVSLVILAVPALLRRKRTYAPSAGG